MNRRHFCLTATTALVATTVSASPAFAAPEIYTSWRNNKALGGYDAVSFFENKPLKGSSKFSMDYKQAEWRFSSAQNLEKFRADPTSFMPQYGGYCAWAIAEGKLAKGSPDYWSMVDGKLYLNFNKKIQKRWIKDQANFITLANQEWPSIIE